MGLQQSKDELLYQQVSYGNIEGIKALRREGAGLEWIDREGKTPLILACINPGLYNVAKSLIELGANVNAYRPGRNAGTPLHHAAKKGLEDVVNLLLSHGANVLIMNDDCQTPLDVARAKGHTNVVRAIERHICLFSGWLREFYGPGFLEVLAPLLVSRKVWVVVLPSGSRKPTMPFKLELAIYSSMQDARPRTVVALWKVNLEEPKLHQSDPSVVIHDSSTKTRIKLASADENDKQQLQWFCNACKGIPQARPGFLANNQPPVVPATAPPPAEDLELTMAINASIQSALQDRPSFPDAHLTYEASASSSDNGCGTSSMNTGSYNGWDALIAAAAPNASSSSERPGNESGQKTEIQGISSIQTAPTSDIIPSAPPVADEEPIHYPSIDFSPIDMPSPSVEKGGSDSSSCVICLDAPVEGACIPCGHMAGCMSCLGEIKAKKWGCPVCRAKIDQIVRLYAV
ncbi:putative E3 ubiquitin-protein ligase XBAT34 isoform X2 [Prunus yedoensis var. nudiflora]|uniref:Putative E3 ubiquitin-protein ligase XBAT34 isoform X2 n=1 Tax=Prunus yedoensis var. nudiflora TaxID=2094558 RepID=A0A314YR64_PRUYE|nr:putative E3 ubiquitin-protein ligase XBAT34 isoform X2 [Prunus yedoensis var. nudiflora]